MGGIFSKLADHHDRENGNGRAVRNLLIHTSYSCILVFV